MIQDSPLDKLRTELARDLRPVKPLRPAWHSALVAFPITLLVSSFVFLGYGLRADASALGFWSIWFPAGLMVAAAYGILVLALMQRAPESTVSPLAWAGLPLLAAALQVGGAYLTYRAHPVVPPGLTIDKEAMCFWKILLIGVPPALLVLWMLSRGLPLRPKLVGLLGGIGGGLISEAVYRLHCPLSHPGHILPWHTGAVLSVGLMGMLVGLWWDRRRLARWVRSR